MMPRYLGKVVSGIGGGGEGALVVAVLLVWRSNGSSSSSRNSNGEMVGSKEATKRETAGAL